MTTPSAGFRSLPSTPDVTDLRNRHRDFYRSLAAEAHEAQLDGDHELWVDLMEADLDNLRAAIEWSLASEDADAALDLVTGTGLVWAHGRYSEGRQWFERSLALDGASPRRRAWALVAYSDVETRSGDREAVGGRASEAVEIARQLADDVLLTLALRSDTRDREDRQAAGELADEAVEAARRTGRPALLAAALQTSASMAYLAGDRDAAVTRAREAVEAIEGGPVYAVTSALGDYATWLRMSGQLDAAATEYERAAAIRRRSSVHPERVVYELSPLAGIALWRGDLDRAAELFREVRVLSADFEDKGYFAGAVISLARIEQEQGASVDVVRGYLLEVVRAVEGQALELGLGAHWQLAHALDLLAELAELEADHAAARRYLEQREHAPRRDFWVRSHRLVRLAELAYRLGDKKAATRHAVARLEELERHDAPPAEVVAQARAALATIEGDVVKAYAELTRDFGDTPRADWRGGGELALFALRAGDLEVARRAAQEEVETLQSQELPTQAAWLLLADVELADGNAAAAADAVRRALRGAHLLWRARERVALIETVGRSAVANGDAAHGAELLGVGRGERDRLQYVTPPHDAAILDAAAAEARAVLGDEAFDTAFDRGRRTPIAEALARETEEGRT